MCILEYGNINNPTIMLVHGFESPYQIGIDYIEHYKENYHVLVPILLGHDVQEKSEFISVDDTAKEIENYCISKSINHIYAIYGMSMGGVLASYLSYINIMCSILNLLILVEAAILSDVK